MTKVSEDTQSSAASSASERSVDQLLDLLIDALEERKAARNGEPAKQVEQPVAVEVDSAEASTSIPAAPNKQGVTRLPKSWSPYAIAHDIHFAEEATAEFITAVVRGNPKILRALTAPMMQNMPDAAVSAFPTDFVWWLPYRQRLSVESRIRKLHQNGMAETPSQTGSGEQDMVNTLPAETIAHNESPAENLGPHAQESHAADTEVDPETLETEAISAESTPPSPTPVALTLATESESPSSEAVKSVGSPPVVSDNLPRTAMRLFLVLLAFVVLANFKVVNISTLNNVLANANDGTTRITFARDGMLLRGSGREVYIIEDNKKRWITTPIAFNARGYRWGMVRQVQDDYLEQFEDGPTVDALLRCSYSPHVFVYTLMPKDFTATRRYIANIETFNALGYSWSDVDDTQCSALNQTKQGDPFPLSYEGRIPRPNDS